MSKKYLYQAFLDRPQFKTQILALLAQGPMWTNELVVRIGLDSNTTARLLAELKDTRKIERIRRKKQGSLRVDSKGLDVLRTEFPGVFGANAPQAMLITERASPQPDPALTRAAPGRARA